MVQMNRKFPFESVYPEMEIEVQKFAVADPKYLKISNPCNVITKNLLEQGMMRQCGYVLPPNYFGLDYLIPVCLKVVDNTANNSPILTFIGHRVKKDNADNVNNALAKCEISNHFVQCPLHQNCADLNCKTRVSDFYMKTIKENQLVILHCFGEPYHETAPSKNPVHVFDYFIKKDKDVKKKKVDDDDLSNKRSRTEDSSDIESEIEVEKLAKEFDEKYSVEESKNPKPPQLDPIKLVNDLLPPCRCKI